jgi:hypothetical protein
MARQVIPKRYFKQNENMTNCLPRKSPKFAVLPRTAGWGGGGVQVVWCEMYVLADSLKVFLEGSGVLNR